MDSFEKEFEAYLINEVKERNRQIIKDAEQALRKNVDMTVYSYNSSFDRNYSLRDSITSQFNNTTGDGIVFFNDDLITNVSAVTGENVGDLLPTFLNYGHTDSTGIDNMYHNYHKQMFVEMTVDEINKKYGDGSIEINKEIGW